LPGFLLSLNLLSELGPVRAYFILASIESVADQLDLFSLIQTY